MNTILILDKDAETGLSENLKERIIRILKEKAHRVKVEKLLQEIVSQLEVRHMHGRRTGCRNDY
ncbi:MAG: hypothetical protein ACUVWJ_08335 [Spirochaetota bacterium]